MIIYSSSKQRHGAMLAGIFTLALGAVLLLRGAGTVPVENFAPQGAMQSDLNAGGHNLTNAATVSAANVIVSGTFMPPSNFNFAYAKLTGTPTTLSGYGITDPVVLTSGSYTNPTWLASLAYAKLTGAPTIPVASVAGRTGTITLSAADISGGVAAANNGSDFSSALITAQNLGVGYSKITAQSSSFTVSATDRGALFNVTTGTATLAVTLPTAANGMFFAVRKADTGTGGVTVNGKLIGTAGQVIEVFSDGTSFHNKFTGGTVDAGGNFSFTEPANGNYNIVTSGTGSFQLNGSGLTLGGNLTTTGAFPVTENFTGTTTLTFPTSGTLLATTGSGAGLTGIPASVGNVDGSLTVSPTTGSVVASLNTAHTNTWTAAQIISANGAASSPVLSFTGTPGTGTGTSALPLIYLNSGTASPTTFSTVGTHFGVNAASGFTGNFIDCHVNGAISMFSVSSGGAVFMNSTLQCGPLTTTNASPITFQARTKLLSFVDGTLALENNAGTSFSLLQLGGTTSSFPALKRSSAGVIARLADDSADTSLEASTFNAAAAQTTVNGSTSGTIVCSEPFAGTSFKMVAIHLSSLSGTASYTFPVGFSNIPHEVGNLGLATTISTSSVTVTGSSTIGDIILVGF